MKAFHCDQCRNLVFFENTQCVGCQGVLGFLPDVIDLSTIEPSADGSWRALSSAAHGRVYKQCANGKQHQVCNWLIPSDDPQAYCASCRLNDVIPDLAAANNKDLWHKIEAAKRRAIYTLLRLSLSTDGDPINNKPALRFRFLSETPDQPVVMTGHDGGVITLNIAEADDAIREQRRVALHEPFRTLVGHFRHEIAHYYWNELIADSTRLNAFRELFGDETTDYSQSLQKYYKDGPPASWPTQFVSAYATAHPWEDWAETSAHYLHIVDTIETAASFGLALKPQHPAAPAMSADPRKVASNASFDRILQHWLPLTFALNELNRGMGLPDLYPFVLSDPAIAKLRFVDEVFARKNHGGDSPAV